MLNTVVTAAGKLLLVLLVVLLVLAGLFAARAARRRSGAPHVRGGGEPAAAFPYLHFDLPPAAAMYARLKTAVPDVTHPASDRRVDAVVTRDWPVDTAAADAVSSHYSETVRARCRFGRTRLSQMEVWNSPAGRAKVLLAASAAEKEALARVHKKLPPGMALREGLLAAQRPCNYFNPVFCLWVYRKLGKCLKKDPDRVRILDPSAGWGDRAIAACAYGAAVYHGFDPNSELKEAYRKIFADFAPPSRAEDFWVKTEPFKGVGTAEGSYDIVLTSPPFFDLEDYPAEGGDEARKLPTYHAWRKHFYEPYVRQSWAAVRPGGFLVLYVDNVKGAPLTKDAGRVLQGRGARRFATYAFRQKVDCPALGLFNKGHPRPAHVWQKPG
jgi:hypothetical protein